LTLLSLNGIIINIKYHLRQKEYKMSGVELIIMVVLLHSIGVI